MIKSFSAFGVPFFCCVYTLFGAAGSGPAAAGIPQIPFAFAENRGQTDPQIRYTGTGPDFKAWFQDRSVILQRGSAVTKIDFGAGGPTVITPEQPLGARANYIHGRDPRHWQMDLPLFGAIRYAGVWPGIELTYKADSGRVKAEYLVAPGADPGKILLHFDGDPVIQPDGSLLVKSAGGDITEDKPVIFQTLDGKRTEVEGGFEKSPDGLIGFWIADYDRTQPLVIDPTILYSRFILGGIQQSVTAIAVDSAGYTLAAGWTSSTDFHLADFGAQQTNRGGVDAFVIRFMPNAPRLVYCTYLGGSGDDRAFGLAVDNSGNAYVTGWTSSPNFPTTAGALQKKLSGTRDAFIVKLNPNGNTLSYSTYLGGTGVDVGTAIAVDSSGSAVVVGDSTSANLPVTANAYQSQSGGAQDAFIARLAPSGNSLITLTYLGGLRIEHPAAVKLDSSNAIVVAGYTWSANFPVVAAFQPKSGGGEDGFITKLSPDASSLIFSTYIGGYGGAVGTPEGVSGLCIDLLGNIVVAGTTSSANFPVTSGAAQTVFGGQTDGFVARFTGQGALLQATYLGGSLNDAINALALDYHGAAYVAGATVSYDLPVRQPLYSANAGSMDAFVFKFTPDLSTIVFGTYLGGSGADSANAIAVDIQTGITVAGQTGSGDFPIAGSVTTALPSTLAAFITRLVPAFTLATAYGVSGAQHFDIDTYHISSFPATAQFGLSTDIPIAGDWDGTGKKRAGVFRNGTWYLDINGDGAYGTGDKTVTFGQAGDVPVVGDWTGTGHISLGLFRAGTFILDLSGHLTGIATGQSDASFTFGQAGDIPICSDWSGSGTTKVGVFRNGLWLVDYNGDRAYTGLDRSYTYGQAGDLPVVGDWDSSGNPAKIGVYRNGLWLLDYDGDNAFTVPYLNELVEAFGGAGAKPLIF